MVFYSPILVANNHLNLFIFLQNNLEKVLSSFKKAMSKNGLFFSFKIVEWKFMGKTLWHAVTQKLVTMVTEDRMVTMVTNFCTAPWSHSQKQIRMIARIDKKRHAAGLFVFINANNQQLQSIASQSVPWNAQKYTLFLWKMNAGRCYLFKAWIPARYLKIQFLMPPHIYFCWCFCYPNWLI